MNTIIEKKKLADKVWYLRVRAPEIARNRKPGQFIILRVWDGGERIPLTIADANPDDGTISMVFQEVGKTTTLLAKQDPTDSLFDLVGPLGNPTRIEAYGTVVIVGGGIGIAPAHPIAQAMRQAGNRVISILGARTGELVIMEEQMRRASDEIIIVTDDGSYGRKALVTQALQDLIDADTGIDLVVAIGPPVMMKFVAETTRPYAIHTLVSLNSIMIDGTGMCGGCRVRYAGENRFTCVDGPEFDGHKVDFDNLMARLQAYRSYEQQSLEQLRAKPHSFAGKGCRFHAQSKNPKGSGS